MRRESFSCRELQRTTKFFSIGKNSGKESLRLEIEKKPLNNSSLNEVFLIFTSELDSIGSKNCTKNKKNKEKPLRDSKETLKNFSSLSSNLIFVDVVYKSEMFYPRMNFSLKFHFLWGRK